MESNELEIIWSEIDYEPSSQYVYKRIDTDCIPELNIGINSSLNRCLLLELPNDHSVDFQSTSRQNLALFFFKDSGSIVLELLDVNFNNLFNDLVLSLYQSIKHVKDVNEYSSIFIQTFHKWSEFFLDSNHERLTEDVIKGLYGELYVLKSLVLDAKSSKVNDILNSWQGPYDKGQDFILDDKNIEVKTKDVTKVKIKISSEYQLEQELGKSFELTVISVENDTVNGITLNNLVNSIKQLVIDKLGDVTILINALQQKKLTFKNMCNYDNYIYSVVKIDRYDPSMEGFPKVIKSALPSSISEVSYNLNLSELKPFLLSSS